MTAIPLLDMLVVKVSAIQAFIKAMPLLKQATTVVQGTKSHRVLRTKRPQNQKLQSSLNCTSKTQLYCVNTAVSVLLQTAHAYITYKPNDPCCGMTFTYILDGRSQRFYIT